MTGREISKFRQSIGLDRHELAGFLGMKYQGLMNIENGVRNASPLAVKVMRYLSDLPKSEALALIEEMNRYEK